MIRAVLDANVIISGSIAPLGASAAILLAWRAEYFEVVTCPAILALKSMESASDSPS